MNIIDIKNIERSNLGTQSQIRVTRYGSVYYNSNPGNCKLCTIDYVSYALSNGAQGIEDLKKILLHSHKLAFNVNVTSIGHVNLLRAHFKEIYVKEAPIGYNAGFQYHCCFFTGYDNYSNVIGYKQRVDKQKTLEEASKGIDDPDILIKSLQRLSLEDIQRIKNYKQPKRAKDALVLALAK